MKVVIVLTGAEFETEAAKVLKHSIAKYDSDIEVVECNNTYAHLSPLLEYDDNLLLLSPFAFVKNSLKENILHLHPVSQGGNIMVASAYENPPVHPRMAIHYPKDDEYLTKLSGIRTPFGSSDAMQISAPDLKAHLSGKSVDISQPIDVVINTHVEGMVDFGINEVYRPDKYLHGHRTEAELRAARYQDKRATISILVPAFTDFPSGVNSFTKQLDVKAYAELARECLVGGTMYLSRVEALEKELEGLALEDEILESCGFVQA